MKSKIGVATTVALAITCLASGQAAAQPPQPGCGSGMLLKWDADAFAYETAYNPATFISSPGSQLNVVGIISVFCAPLQDLDPTDPATEYTFRFTNLTSAGTVGPTVVGGTDTRWRTNYTSSGAIQFQIYQDSPRNAPTDAGGMPPNPPNAQVPAQFIDGTLILEGTLSNIRTTIVHVASSNTYTHELTGSYSFTGPVGGTYYQRLAGTGGPIISTWCVSGSSAQALCDDIPEGYSAHPNGKFDNLRTAVQSSTWGAIKQLYR